MIEQLKSELSLVLAKIKRLTTNDSYFDSLSRSFHLGMVGGSGKNVRALNKRRERSIDKSIENAKILTDLYTKRDNLQKRIEDIENGTAERREQTIICNRMKAAEMWRKLQPGDELPIGNSNGNPIIKTKNRLSVITEGGTKWTATEVIGREAAKYI